MKKNILLFSLIFCICIANVFALETDTLNKRPVPKAYFALFAGAGFTFNIDGVHSDIPYDLAPIFTPLEFGILAREGGLGFNSRFQFGPLRLNHKKILRDINANPPLPLDYDIRYTNGSFVNMQMGLFYSLNFFKSFVIDVNVMPGGTYVDVPSYQLIGRDEEKIRYFKGPGARKELQPSISSGFTVRPKNIQRITVAGRVEYSYLAEDHFIFLTLAVLKHPY